MSKWVAISRKKFFELSRNDILIFQILREINFGEFRNSKIAVFAIFGPLEFVNLVNFSLQKVHKIIKFKIQSL